MASKATLSSAAHPSLDFNLANMQSRVRDMLAQGGVPPEEEIRVRAGLADLLIREYERDAQRNPQHLRDAIEHSEVILRRLHRDSPERPQHLSLLSYAWTSEYVASRSCRVINEAVRCGRLAREEAVATGLPERDLRLYCNILNNVGVALSFRSQNASVIPVTAETETGMGNDTSSDSSRAADDLDEAIECAREVKACVSQESAEYLVTLPNLASRLRQRYSMRGDLTDHTEAVELLQELQLLSPSSSAERALAIMQLAQMAVDKFNKTDALEDLDKALEQVTEAMDQLPQNYEGKPSCLDQISVLYSSRYKKINDVADIRKAVEYSNMALATVPVSHSVRGGYLLNYMRLLRDFTNATISVQDIEEAVSNGHRHLLEMPNEFPKWHSCRMFYGHVLGRKYILSHKLEDLADAILHVKQLCYDYNDKINELGTTPPVDSSFICDVSMIVRKLSLASPGQARDAAAGELYDKIAVACENHGFVDGLFGISKEFVTLLGVYADAAYERETISPEEAHKKAEELWLRKKHELEQRLSQPRWKSKDYETELGLRSLAIDPTNKRIVMDRSGFMTTILGYDPTVKMSHSEFMVRQAQIEKESVEKAKAEGRHPNPKLCHMCRLVKLLCPTPAEKNNSGSGGRGFRWNPDCLYMPFGNWHQLKLRTTCSICQLILSLIVSNQEGNNLHSRLAAIDPEIQGTALRVGELSSGEEVLLVEYGMRLVGELRIVNPKNYMHTIRQGWEARYKHRKFSELMDEAGEGKVDGPLRSAAGQQVDIIMLKRWLNDCDHNHGEACNSSYSISGASARYATDVPLVFIDVVDHCLVLATSAVKYFALSYVWGNVDMLQTLLANYKSRRQTGGLPANLPNTISDAITLVRALGERYLWVDALCIVQDDADHKARDIAHMDVIYSKAFATIAALYGDDANAGLPGVRSRTRPPQRIQTLVVEAGSVDLEYNPDSGDKNEQITLHLVATPRPLHFELDSSRWGTRGWTFQERMLSRRCLYFSKHYVYFQCGRPDRVLSECGVNELVRSKEYLEGEPSIVRVATSLNNPLFNLHQELADLGRDARLARSFKAYSKLVEQYTLRHISYDSDIINAFLGTFTVLNEFFHSDNLCGLPSSALDLALLWAPVGRLRRRGNIPGNARDLTNVGPVLDHLLPTNRGTVLMVFGPEAVPTFNDRIDRRFPSWSWVGWKGPVDFRLFVEVRYHEQLPRSLIREFAININGGELRTVMGRQGQQQRVITLTGDLATAAVTTSALVQAPEHIVTTVIEGRTLSTSNADEQVPIANPNLPNVLQFLAPSVPLLAFTVSTENEYISKADQIHALSHQAVRPILDRQGRRCGLWWEQAGYVYVGRKVDTNAENKMLLVGISEHADTFQARAGPNRVEGEIELFDKEVYPAVGKGSGLINVLAVDLDMGHDYGERVTIARIHAKAWENAGPVVRMIRLA